MRISDKVKAKLRELPDRPGVYFMRDRTGRIIYVGKATSLRNRVRHYFQGGTRRSADPKLRGLINSIADFEFLVARSEADAILTEGRLIKEYRPRYNVFFKDDKRFLLLRVRLDDPLPRFELCRINRNDGATYFGPFANAWAPRATLEFVEKRFGLRRCSPRVPGASDYKHCHNDIIRFCAAPCVGKVTPEQYRERVAEACAFLRGERPDVLNDVAAAMEAAAKSLDFEKAAALRDTLRMVRSVIRERAKGKRDLRLQEEDAARGVEELQSALGLASPPRVIECFDISNISGTHSVASMVCAVDGLPYRQRYRHYRIKTVEGSDDPASMAEVVRRRYARLREERGAPPDLILVDGGVTQLKAAREELRKLGLDDLASAGLAKRFEELHVSDRMTDAPVRLPDNSPALRVVQRIRDEAHRFALDHHRLLRKQRIRDSLLDEVEGIGEKRKQLLLSHFGSVDRMRKASAEDISAVPGIGPVMARAIRAELDRANQPARL